MSRSRAPDTSYRSDSLRGAPPLKNLPWRYYGNAQQCTTWQSSCESALREGYIGEGVSDAGRRHERLPYVGFFWLFSCRNKKRAIYYDTLTDFRMEEMAPFSRRLTWAWEIPRVFATSIWVFPS